MKLLSIFTIIIAIILFTAGLWLWALVIACLAWHIYTRDIAMIRRKLYAAKLLWRSERFFIGVSSGDNVEIKSWCSELDVMQYRELADGCIAQERAVENVLDIVNGK